MRTTFAVGRLTPRSAEIVLLNQGRKEEGSRAPFPGPWKLQALVARLRTRPTSKKNEETPARVH